ncbi:MAG: DUF502 domain-containing protein [Bacteroidia bacterium]|nr:DUF502 domain-containing protein [Bacteroidia bacterium]
MIAQIRRYFVAGLLTILPLALSVYILLVLFRIVDGILGKYLNVYLKSLLGFYIPGLGLALFIGIIFLSGILSIHFFGARLHMFLGRALARFPLLKYIYPSVKKVFEFVFSDNKLGFKKVVLVEYPSKGIWSMGFIANDGFAEAQKKTGKVFYKDKFWGGLGWRYQDAVIVLAGIKLQQGLSIGYSYDISTSAVARFSGGSHELFMSYTRKIGTATVSKRQKSVRIL